MNFYVIFGDALEPPSGASRDAAHIIHALGDAVLSVSKAEPKPYRDMLLIQIGVIFRQALQLADLVDPLRDGPDPQVKQSYERLIRIAKEVSDGEKLLEDSIVPEDWWKNL